MRNLLFAATGFLVGAGMIGAIAFAVPWKSSRSHSSPELRSLRALVILAPGNDEPGVPARRTPSGRRVDRLGIQSAGGNEPRDQ